METCATGYNNLRAEVADFNRSLNDLGNIQHSQLELSHQQILGRFSQLQEKLSAHQQTTDRAGHANAQVPVDSVTTHTLKYFNNYFMRITKPLRSRLLTRRRAWASVLMTV